ncbi:MAG: hypothetical protein M0Q91_02820 [Methanoregula sp.]|nr:hypothetical protein [Methanoregula sp.]
MNLFYEVLALIYRKAKETDPASMEFLTVDAPQDCIHLLASMEQDGSPDIDEARELLQSLKGEAVQEPAWQISIRMGMSIPASLPVLRIF